MMMGGMMLIVTRSSESAVSRRVETRRHSIRVVVVRDCRSGGVGGVEYVFNVYKYERSD